MVPENKKKRLWTEYSRLDIKHLLRWDLSPPLFMELIQGVDVNLVMPCMLPGQPLKLFVKWYKLKQTNKQIKKNLG